MKKTLLVLAMFLISAVVTVFAQPGDVPRPNRERIMAKLNLTDAQQEQFKKIHYETEKKNIDIRAKIQASRLDLNRLFDSESPDRSAIEKKINEIAALEASVKINQFNAWADCNKLLNADQQKIWRRVPAMKEVMSRHGMRSGMMGKPPMRPGASMEQ